LNIKEQYYRKKETRRSREIVHSETRAFSKSESNKYFNPTNSRPKIADTNKREKKIAMIQGSPQTTSFFRFCERNWKKVVELKV